MAQSINKSQQEIINDLYPQKFGTPGKLWTGFLLLVIAVGLYAYIRQLRFGLAVTSLRDYALWGVYISNFVFFVAISLVGSLITAVLRLSNAHWSTPLTRIAEIIAVSAIAMAGLIIVVDMGRPERLYYLFLNPRLQSPIIWDVLVISTYFVISVLLLYIPLIPDIKLMLQQKKYESGFLSKVYHFLGSFWVGSSEQKSISKKAISILCVTIVPVAFTIHTVTSWLFAATYRPGWDSTNFGAYFISGAFLVGAGGVLVAMYVMRKAYKLDKYITDKHFNNMGKITVLLALLYLYFNINEYLVPALKMKKHEYHHLMELFSGSYSLFFWITISLSMVLPVIIMFFPKGRKPFPLFIVGVMIVVGAWFKRYIIVVPTLLSPFLPMTDVPEHYKSYFPSWEEWAITFASMAGALLIMTLLVRYFPVIPVQETIDEFKEQIHDSGK